MCRYGTSCERVRADREPSKSRILTVAIPVDSVNKRAQPKPVPNRTERVLIGLEFWSVCDYGDVIFGAG